MIRRLALRGRPLIMSMMMRSLARAGYIHRSISDPSDGRMIRRTPGFSRLSRHAWFPPHAIVGEIISGGLLVQPSKTCLVLVCNSRCTTCLSSGSLILHMQPRMQQMQSIWLPASHEGHLPSTVWLTFCV